MGKCKARILEALPEVILLAAEDLFKALPTFSLLSGT